MPRKKESTHVRISIERLELLDRIRVGKETNRKVMDRILEDYDLNGIRRELIKKISDLQLFSNNFIHEDLHYCLEILKIIFFKIDDSNNKIEKGIICNVLREDLDRILEKKIPDIIKKDKTDKK